MEKNVSNNNFQIYYLIISYVVWGIFWGCWGVILPEIKIAISATKAELGSILIFIAIGALPTMMGAGFVIKKFTKWTLFFGLLLFSASILSVVFVNSITALSVSLFFIGATSGALDVIMNSGVALLESATGKKYFNIAHASFPIAVILTSPLVGTARQFSVSYKTILVFMALIIATAALLSLRFQLTENVENKTVDDKKEKSKFSLSKIILTLGIVGLLIHVLENAVEQWAAIYLEENLLSSPFIASLGLTLYMGTLFIGRIVAQRLNKKWSDRKVVTLFSALSILGFLVVSFANIPIIAITGFAIAGFGIAPIIPMVFSIASRNEVEERRVMTITIITLIAYAGYMISPILVGNFSMLYSLKNSWYLLSIICTLSTLIIFGTFTFMVETVDSK